MKVSFSSFPLLHDIKSGYKTVLAFVKSSKTKRNISKGHNEVQMLNSGTRLFARSNIYFKKLTFHTDNVNINVKITDQFLHFLLSNITTNNFNQTILIVTVSWFFTRISFSRKTTIPSTWFSPVLKVLSPRQYFCRLRVEYLQAPLRALIGAASFQQTFLQVLMSKQSVYL